MAGASYRDSINADNTHLPTVSVFIVLLAMMAALTTYVRPSTANFEAAKLSILENFASISASDGFAHQPLSADLIVEVEALCERYAASCRPTDSMRRGGMAILFNPNRFDPTVVGLSSSENKFLHDLAAITGGTQTQLSLLLPKTRPIDGADVGILLDLVSRFTDNSLELAVIHAPALQQVSQIGFLLEPSVANP